MVVKFFEHYRQRMTRLSLQSKTYCLYCEDGIFGLYDANGNLVARTFRGLYKCKAFYNFELETMRPEDKFSIVKINSDIIGLKEILTGDIHDYLVMSFADLSKFNEATYLFIAKVLMNHGYDSKSTNGYTTIYDLEKLAISIDNKVMLRVVNCSLIYNWVGLKNVVQHINSIMTDIEVDQFCDLKI